jgi:hypothetical protein
VILYCHLILLDKMLGMDFSILGTISIATAQLGGAESSLGYLGGSGRIRKQYRPLRVSAPREISCTHRRSGVLLRCFENTILARCGNMYNSALRDSVDIDAAGSLRFSRSGCVGCALKLESSRSTCLVSFSERTVTRCSVLVGIEIACRFGRWDDSMLLGSSLRLKLRLVTAPSS